MSLHWKAQFCRFCLPKPLTSVTAIPSNTHLGQSLLNSLELEGFDNGFDFFHQRFQPALIVPACLRPTPNEIRIAEPKERSVSIMLAQLSRDRIV